MIWDPQSANKQKRALAFLTSILETKNLSSPFIFHGDEGDVLIKYAKAFSNEVIRLSGNENTDAKLRSGNHPDIEHIRPEGKSALFSMSDIRTFISDSILPPYESDYKVYILEDVDRMLAMHANALLKTLEEKGSHIVIILTTTNIKLLLPTILSRCALVAFDREGEVKNELTALGQLTDKALLQAETRCFKDLFATINEIDKTIQKEGLASLDEVLTRFFEVHVQKGVLSPGLENLMNRIVEVRLSQERHTRLKTSLEYLFLKPEV